jgi:hypothetical protein
VSERKRDSGQYLGNEPQLHTITDGLMGPESRLMPAENPQGVHTLILLGGNVCSPIVDGQKEHGKIPILFRLGETIVAQKGNISRSKKKRIDQRNFLETD